MMVLFAAMGQILVVRPHGKRFGESPQEGEEALKVPGA
jgi:hypothetical protein